MNRQHPLVFLRKLMPKSETITRWVERGINSEDLKYDDRTTNISDGSEEAPLQQAIEGLDTTIDSLGEQYDLLQQQVRDLTENAPQVEGVREKLTQNKIITVAPTSGGRFTTIQSALDYLEKDLDLNGYQLDIQIQQGDYRSEGLLHLPALVAPKAETCLRESYPTRGRGVITNLVNAAVRIYSSSHITNNVLVAGFELDHHAYYAIQRLSIDVAQNDGITVKRNGAIALEGIRFFNVNGKNNKSSGVVVDNATAYLTGTFNFYNNMKTAFYLRHFGVVEQIESQLPLQLIIDEGYTGAIEDKNSSIFDIDPSTIDDRRYETV